MARARSGGEPDDNKAGGGEEGEGRGSGRGKRELRAEVRVAREAVKLLRRADKQVIYVANKADSQRRESEALELYDLGVPNVVPVSALHGRGMLELEAALFAALPAPTSQDVILEEEVPRVAVV